jgi:hypothetical protein
MVLQSQGHRGLLFMIFGTQHVIGEALAKSVLASKSIFNGQ